MSKSETTSSMQTSDSAPTFAEAPLPIDPTSSSELLSATQIFMFEIDEVEASPWVKQPDRSDKRELSLHATVREVLKGAVAPPVGQGFDVELTQLRAASPWEEPPGLWSRIEVTRGMKLIAVSVGLPTSSAADLLREGAIRRLLPHERAAEVHLAKGAERVFVDAASSPPGGTTEPEILASRAVLTFAQANIPSSGDVFSRYLWARIAPSFVRSEARPTAELVSLLTAPGATNGLRVEIEGALDQVGTELGEDPSFLRTVADGYLRLLLDPSAQPLHNRLVQVSLYLLVFPKDDGQARAPSSKVVPDAAARARYKAALAAFPGERSAKLSSWLD